MSQYLDVLRYTFSSSTLQGKADHISNVDDGDINQEKKLSLVNDGTVDNNNEVVTNITPRLFYYFHKLLE